MPADLPGWLREEAQKFRERGGPPRGGEAVAIIIEHCAGVAEEMLAAEVARVRAQVAEDLAEELAEWARRQRAQATVSWHPQSKRDLEAYGRAYDNAAVIARQHAGKAFPSSAAALPDVVGTPEPAELWDLVGGPRAGFCCQDAYASAFRGENLHTSGCPNRCSKWVPTQRGEVKAYPCALTAQHAGDCWLHPVHRAEVGTPDLPEARDAD